MLTQSFEHQERKKDNSALSNAPSGSVLFRDAHQSLHVLLQKQVAGSSHCLHLQIIVQYILDKWSSSGPSMQAPTANLRAVQNLASRIHDQYITPIQVGVASACCGPLVRTLPCTHSLYIFRHARWQLTHRGCYSSVVTIASSVTKVSACAHHL